MASTAPSSSSLARHPRWLWALTGLTAAYATYTIWSIYSVSEIQPSNTSGLHRRGAIRHPRRRSPQQEQQLLAEMQASSHRVESSAHEPGTSPFGTLNASVNNREQVYHIGPNPPTLEELRIDFHIRDATLRRIHADMQHVLLDIILERLVEPDFSSLLTSSGPVYSSLLPLVEPLRERNIDSLLENIELLTGGIGPSVGDSDRFWRYEQGNVALAFARHCGVDVAQSRSNNLNNPLSDTHLDGLDPDTAETVISSSSAQNAPEPGQGIKGLLYAIAEEQAHRNAYIHRGTRCDSCGEFPIKGIRWHCINCADYDLCSPCESLSPSVHPRTHVFAKIKIPISTLAQPHQVHDLWYPGDPLRHWPTLKVSLRKRLASETGFEDVVLEALYEQFTCLANVAYPNDAADIKAAIDRRAFNKAMSSDKWPAPLEPNFLFDRMFSFYDTDNNSLVGFEEFVSGLAYLRQPGAQSGQRKDLKRVLKGYDVDGDGLLSRADFVRMMSAKYAVQRHIIRDVVTAEEAEIVAHTGDVVRSSQPISAAFTGEDVPYGETRLPGMKELDAFGDMQIAIGGQLGQATLPEDGQVWDGTTINNVARRYQHREDEIAVGEGFRLGHAEAVRERYSRVDNVPIPAAQQDEPGESVNGTTQGQEARFLVETDPRYNRGRPDLEPAAVRWATDLNDSVAGGASGFATPGQQQEHEHPHSDHDGEDGDTGSPYPEFIMDRGRAYPIPENELPFGREVLYQVIQESINELLDPLFLEKEQLAHDARATRTDRQKWRSAIDDFTKKREETRIGANADPLLGIAQGVSDGRRASIGGQSLAADEWDTVLGRRRRGASGRSGNRANAWDIDVTGSSGSDIDGDQSPLFVGHDDTTRSAAPSPTPRQPSTDNEQSPRLPGLEAQPISLPAQEGEEDIATTIRQVLQRDTLPTDDDGLEDLEFNIRQQPLEDLLESAGYSIASPEESPNASFVAPAESSIDAEHDDRASADTGDEDGQPTIATARVRIMTRALEARHRRLREIEDESDRVNRVEERDNIDQIQDSGATVAQSQDRRESVSTSSASIMALPPTSENSEQEEEQNNAHVDNNGDRTTTDIPSDDESMHLSPSSPPTPPTIDHNRDSVFLASIPNSIPIRSATNGNATAAVTRSDKSANRKQPEERNSDVPAQSQLEYWSKLDVEERQILRRGGPGRLTYDEVEAICLRNGGSSLFGLIEGWLEWAGF